MANINKIILPDGNECNIEVQVDNINGVLPFEKGGTNATDLETAKNNLGIKKQVIQAYPISNAEQLTSNWLSETANGQVLTPQSGVIYILMQNSTNYLENTLFRWDESENQYVKINLTRTDIQNIISAPPIDGTYIVRYINGIGQYINYNPISLEIE